jgi:hypothetical protein
VTPISTQIIPRKCMKDTVSFNRRNPNKAVKIGKELVIAVMR